MTRYRATIQVELHDQDVMELHAMTDIAPVRNVSPSATVDVEVHADSAEEGFALALEQATRLAEQRASDH